MLEAEKRGPGRPRKDTDELTEGAMGRRRRKEGAGLIGRRLAVNEAELDFGNFQYRWINDDDARMMTMTKYDDWDIVSQSGFVVKEDNPDRTNAVTAFVGKHPNGSTKLAYLCRKPRKFYEEDQAAKARELDKQLEQLRRGKAKNGEEQADYVPSGGIRI